MPNIQPQHRIQELVELKVESWNTKWRWGKQEGLAFKSWKSEMMSCVWDQKKLDINPETSQSPFHGKFMILLVILLSLSYPKPDFFLLLSSFCPKGSSSYKKKQEMASDSLFSF